MVFCGKHSTACERCRSRRIRCGRQRPACSQCISANTSCSGYRNEVDLLFRDESRRIVQKYDGTDGQRTKNPETGTISNNRDAAGLRGDAHDWRHREALLKDSLCVLSTPFQDVATTFLLTSFLEGSKFSYIPEMYMSTLSTSLLSHAVRAVALASFSNEINQPALLCLAREAYAKSMHLLRTDISVSGRNTSDETLASTLLLSRFESLSLDFDQDSLFDSWSQHVRGSLSIIELRGKDREFSTSVVRQMYHQVINNVNLYRLSFPAYRPETVEHLRHSILQAPDPSGVWSLYNSRMEMHHLAESVSSFRQFSKHLGLAEYERVLEHARILDDELARRMTELALKRPYKTVVVSARVLTSQKNRGLVLHSNKFHIYKDHDEARFWNMVRMLRMNLNENLVLYIRALVTTARNQDSMLSNHATQNLEQVASTALSTTLSLVDDICDSTPQFLRDNHPDCTVGACCHLVWPLLVAARTGGVRCRDFVIDRLLWMADTMKLRVARLAVRYLDLVPDDSGDMAPTASIWVHSYRDDFLRPYYMF